MNLKIVRSSRPVLVVFCRRPQRDQGKQRIAAAIGPDLTMNLAGLLLDAALEDAREWPGPVVISPSSPEDRLWAESLPAGRASVCPQTDGNLGLRLNAVDARVRAGGAQRLIYIGSDAPVLDTAYFDLAQRALDDHDVVLGPAEDGGVVLMGSRQPWPDLEALPWSRNDLGRQLELLCMRYGLSIKVLPERYDIDHAHDLPRLNADLGADPRAARRALRDWLTRHGYDAPAVTRRDGSHT